VKSFLSSDMLMRISEVLVRQKGEQPETSL